MLLPQWLMLLPLSTFVLVDVIAMVADVITIQGVCRVVWQMLKPIVVDVITTSQQFILGLVSEMLNRISSQMCGRWYLPMFLFRDGLFALMYKASFMVLKRL